MSEQAFNLPRSTSSSNVRIRRVRQINGVVAGGCLCRTSIYSRRDFIRFAPPTGKKSADVDKGGSDGTGISSCAVRVTRLIIHDIFPREKPRNFLQNFDSCRCRAPFVSYGVSYTFAEMPGYLSFPPFLPLDHYH
ncbi:hypothetical protein PUN28_000039 [Cardiocondyla obscurior]|uniref:Uncharacterized protein n=1 Tax=Cardiocondyla obscurior TaxID=286306 RepID=A0AAW2GXG1_9HYME